MNDQAPAFSGVVIKNLDELEFAVFCIENLAIKLGITAPQVYRALTESSSILKTFIVPEYEVLHTQCKEYIMDDILDVLKDAGVSI